MAKRHILIDLNFPSPSKHSKPAYLTDWQLCIFCQNNTGEHFQCPHKSTKAPIGYTSLEEDLLSFKELYHMPLDLKLERLDEGDGIKATLMAHSAQWHKKCRIKFNKKMFNQQLHAESIRNQDSNNASVHTRSTHYRPKSNEPTCFFCKNPSGSLGLHDAATHNKDSHVRKCARELNDTDLLTKLAV